MFPPPSQVQPSSSSPPLPSSLQAAQPSPSVSAGLSPEGLGWAGLSPDEAKEETGLKAAIPRHLLWAGSHSEPCGDSARQSSGAACTGGSGDQGLGGIPGSDTPPWGCIPSGVCQNRRHQVGGWGRLCMVSVMHRILRCPQGHNWLWPGQGCCPPPPPRPRPLAWPVPSRGCRAGGGTR